VRHDRELYYLLAATLAVRLPWAFMVPMHEAPDENTHYFIIKYMADTLNLPGPTDLANGGQASVYVPLPQFGYIPHILALWSLSWVFDPSMAPRFGSLLLAPLMTYCAWWLGRELFPSQRFCALAVPLLIVFHPQLVFVHSYANNDVTASTMATGVLCLTAVALKRGLSFKLSALIGFICGWLALTKYTGYAALPAVAVGFFIAAWIHRTTIKNLIIYATSALGITLAMAIPWFARNYQLYNGDFMGTSTMRRHWATLYNRPLEFQISPFEVLTDRKWWRMMYFSYWAMFGYFTRPIWKPLYFVYTGFFTIALIGNLKAVWSKTASGLIAKVQAHLRDGDRTWMIQPGLWISMFTCIAANLLAMIISSSGNVGGAQGRYLLTSEVPFLASIVLGLSLLGSTWGKRLVWGFVGFNLLVYIWSFVKLFAIYGFRWKTF